MLLGFGIKIFYVVDWLEYGVYQVFVFELCFLLDLFWVVLEIDFVGIDNYLLLMDLYDSVVGDCGDNFYVLEDFRKGIVVGEYFDWYYVL